MPGDGKVVATPNERPVATPVRTEQAPPATETTETTQLATTQPTETQPEPKFTQKAGTEPKQASAEQQATSSEPSGSKGGDVTQPHETTSAVVPAQPKPQGMTERQAGIHSFTACLLNASE